MKEDADLEDEEDVMVEHLKNVYLTQRTAISEDKEEQLPWQILGSTFLSGFNKINLML